MPIIGLLPCACNVYADDNIILCEYWLSDTFEDYSTHTLIKGDPIMNYNGTHMQSYIK